MKDETWWWLSLALSTGLIVVLIYLWSEMNTYEVERTQLTNEHDVDTYLQATLSDTAGLPASSASPPIRIKTGIFVQSLKFFNSSDVNITGYIWQRYTDGLHDAVKPGPSEVGFIFPEQVNSGSDIEPREIYRVREGDEEILGWYFEATLRQPFEYAKYPFDHKTVWVRMWPRDFTKNIVLVPDFEAYKATGLFDIFGIEKNIVLGTWQRMNTYFDFKLSSYDSNFGLTNSARTTTFPELHYNFVVKRKFENAFVVYLLPLLLVAALLFAALLTVSGNEDESSRMGFSTTGFISACSALFFVVMLAHIQLREQFAAASIVYLEYYYILMYAMLVLATLNTYLFSKNSKCCWGFIVYNDNILAKVAYWPIGLLILIAVTWSFL